MEKGDSLLFLLFCLIANEIAEVNEFDETEEFDICPLDIVVTLK